jgi:hypothetical protein
MLSIALIYVVVLSAMVLIPMLIIVVVDWLNQHNEDDDLMDQ